MAEKLLMTALSPTMETGTITEWIKKEGDTVANGDVICEVETDKAVMEYESDFDAVILKIVVNAGESVGVGEVIAYYGEKGEEVPQDEESAGMAAEKAAEKPEEKPEKTIGKPAEQPVEEKASGGTTRIKASPLARKMASKMNLDLSNLEGSGYGGRVVKKDILDATGNRNVAAADESGAVSSVKQLSSMRKTIAARLSESKFSAPHFYLTVSADVSELQRARNSYHNRTGEKPSLNAFLIKMASIALTRNRSVNASWKGEEIEYFQNADIGFAAALKDGLITPVIRKCEQKGVIAIDEEFKSLAESARNGGLTPQQYTGAGFTISNLGTYGIEEFTAIINPPGSAILAVGAIIKTPVVETVDGEDAVVIKPMMKMTLSCDHRVIDGAVGAEFLADLKRMIENPVEAIM